MSVVAINGNIIRVGAHTMSSYGVPRFDARACMFESCKGCVAARFGTYQFARIHVMVQVSDMLYRTIGLVLLMYALYG